MKVTLQRVRNVAADAPGQVRAALEKIQDNVGSALDQLYQRVPPLDGVLLEGVVVGTTAGPVAHKLGRAPRGWWLVRKSATGDVWEPSASQAPLASLILQASAPLTVSLWVF